MERIPLYLIALIVAFAHMTTDIYDVHAWNLGTVRAEPWRTKASTGAARVVSAIRAFMQGLWCHRRGIAIAGLIGLALFAPDLLSGHKGEAIGIAVVGGLNVDAMERDLLKKSGEAASLLESTMRACQAHEEKDAAGKVVSIGRLMSTDERKSIQDLIDEGTAIKARITAAKGEASFGAALAALTAGMDKKTDPARATERVVKSLGQQFIETDVYKFAQAKAALRATGWQSDGAELLATTLEEASGSGGQLIITEYRPGILPLLFKRMTVADLLGKGTTDSTSVTYMRETTFTNAAAAVSEGAPKPESTLIFDQVVDQVRKIAHWLPVTDEMLEDVSQIRSYIDARLRLGLDITEEDQLLNGSGTAPNIQGLLNRSGLTTATVRAGAVTNAEAIFVAQMAVFNASFVMPTGTIMNPANWQTTQLSKDGNGQYYGMGPFAGPQPPTLWGLPVAVTPSIVANTAFTGAFDSAAQVFRKGGVRVEASNSHADFFVRNLTAIRAEERLALAVYRPAAFSKITSLT